MKLSQFTFFLILLFRTSAYAQDATSTEDLARPMRFSIEASTTIPLWMGPRINLQFYDQFKVFFGKGFIPKAYVDLMGRTVADLTHKPANEDVMKTVFDTNETWIAGFDYQFTPGSGFMVGATYQKITSSGSTDVNTVGEASGTDLSAISNYLTTNGLSNQITLDSDLDVVWLYLGYTWTIGDNFTANLNAGAAKVMQARESVHTGMADFDATQLGQALLRDANNNLEEAIERNAMTPLLGATVSYRF